MEPVFILVAVVIGLLAGVFLGTRLGRARGDSGAAKVAEEEAEKIRIAAKAEVEAIKQAAEVEGKEAARKRKAELEDDLKQRKAELQKREESIAQKERDIDKQRKDSERRAGEHAVALEELSDLLPAPADELVGPDTREPPDHAGTPAYAAAHCSRSRAHV